MPMSLALYLTPSPLNLDKKDSSVFSGPGDRERFVVGWGFFCFGDLFVFLKKNKMFMLWL